MLLGLIFLAPISNPKPVVHFDGRNAMARGVAMHDIRNHCGNLIEVTEDKQPVEPDFILKIEAWGSTLTDMRTHQVVFNKHSQFHTVPHYICQYFEEQAQKSPSAGASYTR